MSASLVGSEMCIRDRLFGAAFATTYADHESEVRDHACMSGTGDASGFALEDLMGHPDADDWSDALLGPS
eukprot:6804278-Alexandrium_andersonii.AAC.1